MNTAKHLNDSSLPLLPKRRFQYWIKSYIPVFLFSSLLGTYLDLIMVGQNLYSFPIRPFPAVFSINLLFTLVGLPVSTILFLFFIRNRRKWVKAWIIVLLSLGMAVLEKKAEELGIFVHSRSWSHFYTLVGYFLFLFVVDRFHKWIIAPGKR